jgi:hypothetical protein
MIRLVTDRDEKLEFSTVKDFVAGIYEGDARFAVVRYETDAEMLESARRLTLEAKQQIKAHQAVGAPVVELWQHGLHSDGTSWKAFMFRQGVPTQQMSQIQDLTPPPPQAAPPPPPEAPAS